MQLKKGLKIGRMGIIDFGGIHLKTEIKQDEITNKVSEMFDFNFNGVITHDIEFPEFDKDFNIGLIVGSSGSGKSTILNKIGKQYIPEWEHDKAICSHFVDYEDAVDKLSAVGLNSIPDWMKPYHVLSTGQKFRADMARSLMNNALIDEFTSVVDRNVAKSTSRSISKYINKQGLKNIIFCSCHYDIVEYLQPDWVYNVDTNTLARGCLQPPTIEIQLIPCYGQEVWHLFSKHHYLSDTFNKSSQSWIVKWNDEIIGFVSILSFPNGSIKNGWRLHRTVVLPDYQGLGIGTRITEGVGEIVLQEGGRLFAKTSHPRVGYYRNHSSNWRPTSKNGISRKDYDTTRKTKEDKYKMKHKDRVCFSHEYIGKTLNS